jgi:NADH-quinone oxidoreductase subunit N
MYPIILLSFLGVVTLFLGFSKSKNILLPSDTFVSDHCAGRQFY